MSRSRWKDLDEVVRRRYPDEKSSDLAADLGVPLSALYKRANDLGVGKSAAFQASPASGRRDSTPRVWTPERDEVLRARYPDEPTSKLAAELGLPVTSVYAQAKKLGVTKSPAYMASEAAGRLDGVRGAATRFAKGNVPWTKGKTGIHFSPETEFKKGQRAHNYMEVGARKLHDGYTWIKVAEGGWPEAWRAEHRVIWEAHTGAPVPEGHQIAFRDGNRRNIAVDNLELITDQEKAERARQVFRHYPPELRQVILLRGALVRQITRINKRKKA
jgi:hypothetical protein